MLRDGTLVREQRRPTREVAEIGDRFLSVRRPPEGSRNLLPIPSGMKPVFEALRHAAAGDAEALAEKFSPTLVSEGVPWRVRLVPRAGEAAGAAAGEAGELEIVLVGCGASLRGMELIRENGGVRRIFLGRS